MIRIWAWSYQIILLSIFDRCILAYCNLWPGIKSKHLTCLTMRCSLTNMSVFEASGHKLHLSNRLVISSMFPGLLFINGRNALLSMDYLACCFFQTAPRRQLQITTDDNYKCTFYIANPPYRATSRGREWTEGARRASGVHSLPRRHSTTHHLSPLIFFI
jgi:hypothetical protein